MDLLHAAHELVGELKALSFAPPVSCVYNPLEYAAEAYARYVAHYAQPRVEAILLGMNPGPFGMAQTGVPFGDVAMVRDWLGIRAEIGKPPCEHPKRPISGFDCPRREVSGTRLWGWARHRFQAPEAFFQRFFVANYCPLCFMEDSGRNRTPDKLPAAERQALYESCDLHLRRVVEHLRPQWVIGVGGFAARRAEEALDGRAVQIGQILHPSPASPRANAGWAGAAERQLRQMGLAVD